MRKAGLDASTFVWPGPAHRHSEAVKRLVINPQLTESLMVDAHGADALPLLALTLEWHYREFTTAAGTHIGLEEYHRLGGVRGIIGRAVQRAFERPTASGDRTARVWQESWSSIDDPQELIGKACGWMNPEAHRITREDVEVVPLITAIGRKEGDDVCEGVAITPSP